MKWKACAQLNIIVKYKRIKVFGRPRRSDNSLRKNSKIGIVTYWSHCDDFQSTICNLDVMVANHLSEVSFTHSLTPLFQGVIHDTTHTHSHTHTTGFQKAAKEHSATSARCQQNTVRQTSRVHAAGCFQQTQFYWIQMKYDHVVHHFIHHRTKERVSAAPAAKWMKKYSFHAKRKKKDLHLYIREQSSSVQCESESKHVAVRTDYITQFCCGFWNGKKRVISVYLAVSCSLPFPYGAGLSTSAWGPYDHLHNYNWLVYTNLDLFPACCSLVLILFLFFFNSHDNYFFPPFSLKSGSVTDRCGDSTRADSLCSNVWAQ